MSKFEILPNEILLEIFEYLPTFNIFQTFYYLNQRYNQLLLSIRLRVDLFNITKQMFDFYNYFLFPIASHSVISLRCEDVFDRLIYHIHLQNFLSLEYLTIININPISLKSIIPNLNKFPNLIYLNLQMALNQTITNELFFEESMNLIEKCILNFNKRLIIQGEQSYPNLKYLTINQYHIQDLISFLNIYTPDLRHLTVTLNDEYNAKELLRKTDGKHQLQSISIKQCRIPFDRIEQFILTSLVYLKRLNINAVGTDYADGRQWERVLSPNLPHLTKFELYTTFPREDASTADLRTQLLKTFDTTYFLSHNWYFAFICHPSSPTIDLFSIPLINNKIFVYLYDTHIEKTLNDINLFENVNELSLYLSNSQTNLKLPNFSFSNVKNLKLISRFRHHETPPKMMIVDVSYLLRISKLESIELIGNNFLPSTFHLLNYTTKLQSLSISFDNLIRMTNNLNDKNICSRLTSLIKNLTITGINDLRNLVVFEHLPIVFSHLQFLSLTLMNSKDFYPLIILILSKMAPILQRMVISVETYTQQTKFFDEFMAWLISYMHSHDLEKVDVKHTDNHIDFCF